MSRLNKLSHYLAKVLRHTASSEGLTIPSDGYVDVDEILKRPSASGCSQQDVENVVRNDSKKRFHLRNCLRTGKRQIRANQGHSIPVQDLALKEITHPSQAPIVLHGTSLSKWETIKPDGLSRMRREHIHFAPGEDSPDVISGIPGGCDIIISIDLRKALAAGIKFYRSENAVILSPGDARGKIPVSCFKEVYHRRTRKQFYP